MAIKKYDKLGKHAIYWVIFSIENSYSHNYQLLSLSYFTVKIKSSCYPINLPAQRYNSIYEMRYDI